MNGQDIKVKGRQIIDVVLVSTAVKIQEVSVVAKIKNKVISSLPRSRLSEIIFLRTRFKVPAEMFSSNTRLIVQPTLYNITRKRVFCKTCGDRWARIYTYAGTYV